MAVWQSDDCVPDFTVSVGAGELGSHLLLASQSFALESTDQLREESIQRMQALIGILTQDQRDVLQLSLMVGNRRVSMIEDVSRGKNRHHQYQRDAADDDRYGRAPTAPCSRVEAARPKRPIIRRV
jgi:hypothetical protein